MSIKIYIGTEPNQWLPTEVLRWSIKSRTQAPVEFHELKHISLNLKNRMYTGFSFYRFAIPEATHYQGRAIYLDADIVVLDDIKNLFDLDMKQKGALARKLHSEQENGRYTSVMLLDTEKLKHWKLNDWVEKINANPQLYDETLWVTSKGLNAQDFGDLPDEWNHLDQADAKTKIIHYTNVPMQPWKRSGHPYGSIFLKELKAAIENDEIPLDAVELEIKHGHIYPDILKDMKSI